MEFALELIIKASRLNLKRTEVVVDLHPRKGESKLRTFRMVEKFEVYVALLSQLFISSPGWPDFYFRFFWVCFFF